MIYLTIVLSIIIFNGISTIAFYTLPRNSLIINKTNFDNILKFSTGRQYCSEMHVENAPRAQHILKILHTSHSCPSLLNESKIKHIGCDFHIYISSSIDGLIKLLTKYPMHRSRFLILLYEVNHSTNFEDFVKKEGLNYIGSGKGILFDFENPNILYKYNPIHKTFRIISLEQVNVTEEIKSRKGYENFEMKKLKVGTFNCTINSRIGPLDRNGKPEWLDGVEMNFLDDLSKKLNFTYEIVVPKDGNGLGSVDRYGAWHGGLMELVGDKHVDLAFCGAWLTNFMRMSNLSLTTPINDICLTFLIPRPQPVGQMGFGIFRSFRWEVWAAFASQTLLLACFLPFTAIVAIKIRKRHEELASLANFPKTLLVLCAILCNNAPRSLNRQGPLRHIIAWWAIVALILNTSFSSSLISHLTKANYAKPIDTFKELVENDFSWCTKTFPTFGSVFNLEDEWEKKWTSRYCVADPDIQCEFIENDEVKYAIFVIDYGEGAMTDIELPCTEAMKNYEEMNNCATKLYSGLVLQTNSPYLSIFSDYITRYQESGIFHKGYEDEFHQLALKDGYITDVKITISKKSISRVKLKLSNTLATFYIFICGIILSIVVFILEHIWYNRKEVFDFVFLDKGLKHFGEMKVET